jgi:Protein of unknown function (DUF3107)
LAAAGDLTRPATSRRTDVDVRIGVTQAPREIELELGDDVDADRVTKLFEEALAGESGILWLTDRKGRRIGVPAAKVAYLEIGTSSDERRVGFGSSVAR